MEAVIEAYTLTQVAEREGVSKTAICNRVKRGSFPRPDIANTVWSKRVLEDFDRRTETLKLAMEEEWQARSRVEMAKKALRYGG